MNATDIPEGYQPHTRRSPLTEPWEPLFARPLGHTVQLAVQVREAHCNSRGLAHGGLIAALADNAMGLSAVTTARSTRPEQAGAVTVGLTLDYIDSARPGDWLEFHPTVLRCGATLAFVECRVVCGERVVARGSASFKMA
ncbi:MAG: PaaI family thioesterase [Burkholderiales bacterium]|nr:PaaI family thioesterase [Burkholderiales bacterium]